MAWAATVRHGCYPAHAAALAHCAAALVCGASAFAQQAPSASVEQTYDIPAEPVSSALARFAKVSGVDILYENAMGSGRICSPVHGAMPAQAALRILLRGTGLSARFTEAKAAIVFLTAGPVPRAATRSAGLPELRLNLAEVRAAAMIGSPDRSSYQRYAQAVQLDIRRILSEGAALRGLVFRVHVSLKVGQAGRIERVLLLRGSGDEGHDAVIRKTLLGRSIAPPPPGLKEPLYFEVATDRLGAGGPS